MDTADDRQDLATIEHVIENFNFAQVETMMHAVGWKWEGEVITKAGLRNIARRLFARLLQYGEMSCAASGGLRASRYESDEGEVCYQLEFIGEESVWPE